MELPEHCVCAGSQLPTQLAVVPDTTQALFVTMTLLRMLQFRLDAQGHNDWWLRPPWNKRKTQGDRIIDCLE